ncbi:MAG: hypothetical protein Q4P15_10805 [Propionibacteriaceae bacterium]|nr:hypothetical protein [Propionibacteriaceae bacterium]
MNWSLDGLPLHALLVHLTVVVVPAAALAVVLTAVWPTARRRLGIVTPILAGLSLIMVPFTVNAGKWLYERVDQTPGVQEHEEMGTTLLPWAVALFVVAVLQWAWFRVTDKPASASIGVLRPSVRLRRALTILLLVAVLVTAVGSVVTVVRIGDSGARAVWIGKFSDDS